MTVSKHSKYTDSTCLDPLALDYQSSVEVSLSLSLPSSSFTSLSPSLPLGNRRPPRRLAPEGEGEGVHLNRRAEAQDAEAGGWTNRYGLCWGHRYEPVTGSRGIKTICERHFRLRWISDLACDTLTIGCLFSYPFRRTCYKTGDL